MRGQMRNVITLIWFTTKTLEDKTCLDTDSGFPQKQKTKKGIQDGVWRNIPSCITAGFSSKIFMATS